MQIKQGKPYPLGTEVLKDRVNFAVSVREGKICELLLYKKGNCVPYKTFKLGEENAEGSVRFAAVGDIDPEQYEYNYRIDKKIVTDPYARELAGHHGFGEEDIPSHFVRCRIAPEPFDWEGDRRLNIPLNEVIAYSLHVRGFTKHSSSGVRHKGTFLGVIEKLPYLQDLGINQIQCMPIYEFEECAGKYKNYWGYGNGCYFAPKASFSAGDSAVCELKKMVRECHKAGIEVVLEMPFADGVLPQTALKCLRFYMSEYHIDGFVVNPYRIPWQMLVDDPYLKGVKIMQKKDDFQNIMRRFLKGDEGMAESVIWALRHLTSEDGSCNYITAQTGFTLRDLVSYDGKHNEANGEYNEDGPKYNYSWNCGVEGPTRKKSVSELRKRQIYNAFFLLLTAQGTPCILAGDEFGNSQGGNNNVYCQDNETAWLNWSRRKEDVFLHRYVKALIRFRKSHPILSRPDPLLGADRTSCGVPDVSYHGSSAWVPPTDVSSRILGVMYSGRAEGFESCFIAYNMHWETHSFALPKVIGKGEWHMMIDTDRGCTDCLNRLENQKFIELKPRSIALLVSKDMEENK